MVLDFLAVDNFDFTRKIVKIILGGKLIKMLGGLSKLNFFSDYFGAKIHTFFSKKNCCAKETYDFEFSRQK